MRIQRFSFHVFYLLFCSYFSVPHLFWAVSSFTTATVMKVKHLDTGGGGVRGYSCSLLSTGQTGCVNTPMCCFKTHFSTSNFIYKARWQTAAHSKYSAFIQRSQRSQRSGQVDSHSGEWEEVSDSGLWWARTWRAGLPGSLRAELSSTWSHVSC